MRRTVQTLDGRLLAVEDHGDPAGWPVLVHHGTPSSRSVALYGPWARDAARSGLRLISYDRPGYGESSPQPGRTVTDTVDDIRAICAELGIDRMATWGHSGGGPHALACASLLPDLVTAAATLASLAPFGAEGIGWPPDDVHFIRLFLADEAAARKKLDKDREELMAASPNGRGEFRDFMCSCMQAGVAPGNQGWWDDNSMQLRPWGFDLADITVPVLLLHGRQDILVPASHCEWLAKHIPGADVRLFDDDGHDTIARHVPEVNAWLSGHR